MKKQANKAKSVEEIKKEIELCEDSSKRARLCDTLEKEVAKACVKPVHFCIDEKDVDVEYDAGAFVLSKAGGYMHYMTKGGYHLFVGPSYDSLYKTMDLWLQLLVANKEKGEDKDENILNISDFISSLLFANTVVFSNEEFMFKQFDLITDIIKQMAEKSEKELSKQDFDANADFENGVKSVDKLKDILEQAEAEQTEKDKQ